LSGRLLGPVTGLAAAAVVDQRVHGLLKHSLFIADNDVGRAEIKQPFQAVVAVDDSAVQVIQVGCRKAAAVKLHHRSKLRRNYRITSRIIHSGLVARICGRPRLLQAV
jgi:hypothetical protein